MSARWQLWAKGLNSPGKPLVALIMVKPQDREWASEFSIHTLHHGGNLAPAIRRCLRQLGYQSFRVSDCLAEVTGGEVVDVTDCISTLNDSPHALEVRYQAWPKEGSP